MKNKRYMRPVAACLLIPFFSALSMQTEQDSLQTPDCLCYHEISLDSVQHRNYQDLGDLMWLFPGIWTRDLGGTGQWNALRVEGSSTDQVHILWDGLVLNDLWSGQPDLTLLPIDLIGSIAQLEYDNALSNPAIGGVFNFESVGLKTARPYTRIVYRNAADHFSDTDVLFSQQLTPKWRLQSGVRFLKYGSSDLYEDSNTKKHRGETVFAKISYQLSPQWQLNYQVLSNKKDRNLPYTIAVRDTLIIGKPRLKQKRQDQALTCSGTWNHIQNRFLLQYTSDETTIRNRSDETETAVKATLKRVHWNASRSWVIPLNWGSDLSRQSFSVVDSALAFHNTIWHHWVSTRVPIISGISFSAKANLMHETNSNWHFLYRTGAEFSPWHKTTIGVSYRTALRMPTASEKYGFLYAPLPATLYQQTIFQEVELPVVPNQTLKPETGQILEMQLQWGYGPYQASIVGYHRQAEELIQPRITTQGIAYQNMGTHTFTGLDVSFSAPVFFGFQLENVFSYLKATDSDESSLLERPYFWGNSGLTRGDTFFDTDLITRLTVAIRYWSDFHNLTMPHSSSNPYAYQPANFAIDAKLLLTFMQDGTLGLAFDNILNRKIYLVDSLALRGRVFRLQFVWELFD